MTWTATPPTHGWYWRRARRYPGGEILTEAAFVQSAACYEVPGKGYGPCYSLPLEAECCALAGDPEVLWWSEPLKPPGEGGEA